MKFAPRDEVQRLHNHIQHFLEIWGDVEDPDDPVIVTLSAASDALFGERMISESDDLEITVDWDDEVPIRYSDLKEPRSLPEAFIDFVGDLSKW